MLKRDGGIKGWEEIQQEYHVPLHQKAYYKQVENINLTQATV